jgi:hypothetical protein
MINLLISEYTRNDDGSMNNTFGYLVSVQKDYFGKGWETLDEDQNVKLAPTPPNTTAYRKSLVKNHGAHLLLLLTYIMLSNGIDDESNESQM